MEDIIFCPSAPQSGTWFVLRFMEKCGYKIEHMGEFIGTDKKVMDRSKPSIVACHFFPYYYQGIEFKGSYPTYGDSPVTDEIVRKGKVSTNDIEFMCSMYKTIIPIRDPLASLLTREARAPQLRHFYITDAYLEIIKRFKNHPNVDFLPVEVLGNKPTEVRKNNLIRVLEHCGINPEQHNPVINQTAKTWGRENETPNHRFREVYDNGEIKKIKEMLGEKWAEVEYLKIFGGTIKPFLRALGHTGFLW